MQFLQRNDYREYFVKKFGISWEVISHYTFWERGRKVWAFSGKPLELEEVEILGIKALTKGKDLKPSTAFIRIIGKHATRNVVKISDEEAYRFLRGETLEIEADVERGYVIVTTAEDVIGCGFYDGKLRSLIPSKYRIEDTWV